MITGQKRAASCKNEATKMRKFRSLPGQRCSKFAPQGESDASAASLLQLRQFPRQTAHDIGC